MKTEVSVGDGKEHAHLWGETFLIISLSADFQKRVVVSISNKQFSQRQFFTRWNPVGLGLYLALFLSHGLITTSYPSLFRHVILKNSIIFDMGTLTDTV